MSRKAEDFQFSYDRKFDVLFLYKKGAKSAGGIDYGNVTFGLDEEKRMVGIEIIEATEFLAHLTSLSKAKVSKSLSTISGCRVRLSRYKGAVTLHLVINSPESPIDTNLTLVAANGAVPVATAA